MVQNWALRKEEGSAQMTAGHLVLQKVPQMEEVKAHLTEASLVPRKALWKVQLMVKETVRY